ncbi:hypothetical protein [Arthrobacter sp. Z4-13]
MWFAGRPADGDDHPARGLCVTQYGCPRPFDHFPAASLARHDVDGDRGAHRHINEGVLGELYDGRRTIGLRFSLRMERDRPCRGTARRRRSVC